MNRVNNNLGQEISAGLIGYLTTVYIVVVNSAILADAGLDMEFGMIATILASTLGCILMGIWAKLPLIIIPGMGVNALFTYSIVQQYDYSYGEGLGVVVIASLIFVITAFTPMGSYLSRAIPNTLKHGITIGLGLFLILIGLENAQLIVSGNHSIISLGDLSSPYVIVSLVTLLIGVLLFVKNVPANFLITMIVGTMLTFVFGLSEQEPITISLSSITDGWVAPEFHHIGQITFWAAVLPLALVLIFETIGILQGQVDMLEKPERYKVGSKSSSIAALFSGFFGTSPTIPAAENAAVIAAKGRTGLASVVAGILFLSTILLIPYISMIPANAISPILIIVGVLMMQNIKHINVNDLTEAFPMFLIMFMIPFTYSIADGMAFGFIAYPLIKYFTGNKEATTPILWVIAGLFVLEFIVKATM
ncbi:NCS2 family permease [Allobacillus sp. SKP2-8]|uniref:NCS2 family permease n=1 Tax=unclassified Allobacillus TaxID=2628859 RepID=UPI0011824563|nr:NCS2 family permease [Allobacillus sp. SKP2-8]TSJ69270.1 NCS2 family permease [Allobacillus sp. SKP2-8]